jgi:hypothetical protein
MPTPDASQYTQIKRMQADITWHKNASVLKFRAPLPYQLPSYAGVGISGFPINSLISNKFTTKTPETPPEPPAEPPPAVPIISGLTLKFEFNLPVGGPYTSNSLTITFNSTTNAECLVRFKQVDGGVQEFTVTEASGEYTFNPTGTFREGYGDDSFALSISPDNETNWYNSSYLSVENGTTVTVSAITQSNTPVV